MRYLDPTFSVGGPSQVMRGTCERCVWGTGDHAEGCTSFDAWVRRSIGKALATKSDIYERLR